MKIWLEYKEKDREYELIFNTTTLSSHAHFTDKRQEISEIINEAMSKIQEVMDGTEDNQS